jgi:hypothetical protein
MQSTTASRINSEPGRGAGATIGHFFAHGAAPIWTGYSRLNGSQALKGPVFSDT